MIITTPLEITDVLYDGTLEFDKLLGNSSAYDEITKSHSVQITIGKPQWWSIAELYREMGDPVPAAIGLLLRDADFFLVQLACSFRAERDTHLDWARFSTYLRPRNTAVPKPIAFDLYPVEVYEEVSRDLNITLSPSLNFKVVEAKLGEIGLQIPCNKLLPVITAAGALESNFSWDLEKTENHPLRGTRWFYALVKCPRGAEGVRATFGVVADIITPRGLLRAALRKHETKHLSCLICA